MRVVKIAHEKITYSGGRQLRWGLAVPVKGSTSNRVPIRQNGVLEFAPQSPNGLSCVVFVGRRPVADFEHESPVFRSCGGEVA